MNIKDDLKEDEKEWTITIPHLRCPWRHKHHVDNPPPCYFKGSAVCTLESCPFKTATKDEDSGPCCECGAITDCSDDGKWVCDTCGVENLIESFVPEDER